MNSSNPLYNEIKMLESQDPSERRTAVEDLMSMDLDEKTVQMLSSALSDPDKGVRDSASFTLIFNGHPSIPGYVIPYVSAPDIAVRNLAGEVLLRIGENSVDCMTDYIDAGNDDDKKFVIDILGLIGQEKPVNKILEVLASNKNDNVILSCIEALGNIGYAPALPTLTAIYEGNELFKPTIIEALGKMNSQEALDFITYRYPLEDELTKFSIIESLGTLGNEATFYFLLSELRKITGPLIWPIIASLCQLKEKLGLDIPFDESTKNSILYTLLEADTRYKRAAARLITIFDDKDIMDALLRIYGEDSEIDENIKPVFFQYASLLYAKLSSSIRQNPSNLKYLLWLMKDIIEFDGGETLNGVSELDRRNLSDSFILCLNNPDEEIRKTSIELIFLTSLECALVFIDSMIEDDNMWNRLKVLEIVENIFEPKINEALKTLANDPEEMIRERAVWALAQRGITNLEIKSE
ncbi:MAG: HEAT repeat domain-containing protein [Ignavibacteriales bacterium]